MESIVVNDKKMIDSLGSSASGNFNIEANVALNVSTFIGRVMLDCMSASRIAWGGTVMTPLHLD